VGAVFSPFYHSSTDNISFNLNLAFWTTLLWIVLIKAITVAR